jgi:hypothetical protein
MSFNTLQFGHSISSGTSLLYNLKLPEGISFLQKPHTIVSVNNALLDNL